jgi:hypothetical protein
MKFLVWRLSGPFKTMFRPKNVKKLLKIFLTTLLYEMFPLWDVFQPSFDDISAVCWPIWMQNSVLETSLVVNYMTEIQMWNIENFMPKFGSEVEIWWKSGFCDHIFLNNFLMLSFSLGQIYIFWKLRMPANWK